MPALNSPTPEAKSLRTTTIRFAGAFLVCTVVSTNVWDCFVAGSIYHCTDSLFIEFLTPGEWAHLHEGDTLRTGWSITGLWWLWAAFVFLSLIISLVRAGRKSKAGRDL